MAPETYKLFDQCDILVKVPGKSGDILDKKIRNKIRKKAQ